MGPGINCLSGFGFPHFATDSQDESEAVAREFREQRSKCHGQLAINQRCRSGCSQRDKINTFNQQAPTAIVGLYSLSPMVVLPGRVQYGRHDHRSSRFDYLIDHSIRKPARISPTNVLGAMPAGVQERIFGQRVPHSDYLLHKFSPQSRLAGVVPGRGFRYIALHFGTKLDAPTHFPGRTRNRAFISSKDRAEPGLRRWASSRPSTVASSSADNPVSSNSRARRTRICRSDTVSAGNSANTSLKLMMV